MQIVGVYKVTNETNENHDFIQTCSRTFYILNQWSCHGKCFYHNKNRQPYGNDSCASWKTHNWWCSFGWEGWNEHYHKGVQE